MIFVYIILGLIIGFVLLGIANIIVDKVRKNKQNRSEKGDSN